MRSVMFNYVCEKPPGGQIPNLEAFRLFARVVQYIR